MKNEFDDKLKHGAYSGPDPSDEDYYLDDDYQDPNAGYEAKDWGYGSGKGYETSHSAAPHSSASHGAVSRSSASHSFASQGAGRELFRTSPSSGTVKRESTAKGQQARPRSTQAPNQQPKANAQRTGQRPGEGRPQSASRQTAEGSSTARGQIVIGDGGVRQPPRTAVRDSQMKAAASRSAAQAEKKKKVRRIIIMAVAEVFTLAFIFAYAYVARLMNTIQRPDNFNEKQVANEVLTAEQKKHMTGFRTIAVFGVDSRDGNVNRGTNADVIMICNINRDTGEIRLVSVFRDTYLNTNEGNTYNKINSAYANGGASQALAAINRNLDLDITEYVTFNWKAVADGINMLGGVDIDISKAEFRYINSFITETVEKTGVPSVHLKSAGMNHLDGVQAVAYGRLRLMDTDYARTERQRLVIQKAFEKAKKADLGLLNRILLTEVEQVGTNLTFSDFTELILDIGKYHIGETGGFPFARGDMKMGKKGDCVIPQTLETNVAELHKFLFAKESYEPSDMVKKISAKIAADSGMYKQGTSVDHVPTDKGTEPKETKGEGKQEKTTEADLWVKESDIDESSSKPEASSGAGIEETKETKPGETRPESSKPGETKPESTKPGEIKPGESRPSETTEGSKPEETKPSHTESTAESSTENHGPGMNQTTAAHETTAGQTSASGPGPTETTRSQETAGGPSDALVISGPPGTN